MLLAHQPVPRGKRVAIVTNAGGPGILAADACESQGLELPSLSDATVAELRAFLPAAASVGNPVDMIASASADSYGRALRAVLRDDRVDSVLVIFIPPLVTHAEEVARAVREAALGVPDKPVLGIFMSAEESAGLLTPIPRYEFPEAAAVALARATKYGTWLRTPVDPAPSFQDLDRSAARKIVDDALARGGGWLTPDEAQSLARAVGIDVPRAIEVHTAQEAVAAAEAIGGPVVLKAVGPSILHKTESGAVKLGLDDAPAMRAAWEEMTGRLGIIERGGLMAGGLVQAMVSGGVEMLVGVTDDPTFGAVMVCASGGILAELLHDADFRLHPLSARDADDMIASLRGAALLKGYRGSPPADVAALKDVLLRVSALVSSCPEIQELDINPLSVRKHGATALDIRVRVAALHPPPATRRVMY
jgi:acyl-CoA synthetase (NDP forming)